MLASNAYTALAYARYCPAAEAQLGAGKREWTGGQEHAIAEAVSIPASQQCVTISTESTQTVLALVSDKQLTARSKLNVCVAISNIIKWTPMFFAKADVTHTKHGQSLVR